MASLLLPVWGMFIVWEKRSRQLKVTLDLKGPTAIAQDQSWPILGRVLVFGFSFANKEQWSPSGGTLLSFANTKLAASLRGCLLFVKHWLFIYFVVAACPLGVLWGTLSVSWTLESLFRLMTEYFSGDRYLWFAPHVIFVLSQIWQGRLTRKCFGERLRVHIVD